MTDFTDGARPVPTADLPEGVTCILGNGSPLTHGDLWQVQRFRQFLIDDKAATDVAEKKRILREYLADTEEQSDA